MKQFAVTQRNGEWTVFEGGAPLHSGMSRSAAVEIAEKLAFDAEESGEYVELVIQDYTGEVRTRLSGGD
jgi:hypothetical protein